jgi:hypothetical protein
MAFTEPLSIASLAPLFVILMLAILSFIGKYNFLRFLSGAGIIIAAFVYDFPVWLFLLFFGLGLLLMFGYALMEQQEAA